MELDTRSDADGITGTLTGLYYAGGIFGCLLNGYLADHIGRKGTAITAYITLLISSACLAGSVNVAMFIVFRFFVGARYIPHSHRLTSQFPFLVIGETF
jgi:MFS family permease